MSDILTKHTGVSMLPQLLRLSLLGLKTVTRRPLREQPPSWARFAQPVIEQRRAKIPDAGQQYVTKIVTAWDFIDENEDRDDLRHWPGYYKPLLCPYGDDGDLLYVKEPFSVPHRMIPYMDGARLRMNVMVHYEGTPGSRNMVDLLPDETKKFLKWKKHWDSKPAMYMFKSMARYWFMVGQTRPERILDITDDQAALEGIVIDPNGHRWTHNGISDFDTPREAFLDLWASIYGQESLDRNDWVWVVPFTPVPKPTLRP